MDHQADLISFKPSHEYFTGIDSDGCVFDTMEVKQKDFFIPNALKFFELDQVSEQLRETWEFVNLYSVHRGGNRFTSLIKVFELLGNRKSVRDKGVTLPDLSSLKEWVKKENKLSNYNLLKYYEARKDASLEKFVVWTEAVNSDISKNMCPIPPFPHAKAALQRVSEKADIVIVSQTPLEALEKEWNDHDLKKFVRIIAGQEHGTKSEHLELAAAKKYPSNKILMIGDAAGDAQAAISNDTLFYPVVPGYEDESWERFIDEGFPRFVSGTFKGKYEKNLFEEFRKALPDVPPWND